MKPVRFTDAAREEFLAGVERYGARFRSAVNSAAKSIGRFPKAWALYPAREGMRRFVLKRYPFALVYRETTVEIRVLAVAHTRRKPGYWRRRR
jgi:plasmid stabilization system protein ParE